MIERRPTTNSSSRPAGDEGRASARLLGPLVWPLLATCVLLSAMLLFPRVDPLREPYFDLTSGTATFAYWAAQSGGRIGGTVLAATMILLLITRPGIAGARRIREAGLFVIVVGVCAGAGVIINENAVKPFLQVPRPNIRFLSGADGAGPLGMTPEAFYDQGDKQLRGTTLRSILEADRAPIRLTPAIREHWIMETGYSFPSGHSFAAMFLATFFLACGVQYVSSARRWLFYLLLPWALAVCYSRPILRVHTPTDVLVGGFEGLAFGILAFLFVRATLTAWQEKNPQAMRQQGKSPSIPSRAVATVEAESTSHSTSSERSVINPPPSPDE